MKRSRKIALVAMPVAVAVGAAVALSAWSNDPAEGTIHTGKPAAATQAAPQATPLSLDNALFATTLPTSFVQKDTSPPTAEVTVRVLATNASTRQQVGISGGTLPGEGLSGVADYNLRIKNTAEYKRSTATTLPAGSTAFEDTASSMVTLFWPHGGKYVSITVSSSPGSTRELYDTLSKTLQAWQWK